MTCPMDFIRHLWGERFVWGFGIDRVDFVALSAEGAGQVMYGDLAPAFEPGPGRRIGCQADFHQPTTWEENGSTLFCAQRSSYTPSILAIWPRAQGPVTRAGNTLILYLAVDEFKSTNQSFSPLPPRQVGATLAARRRAKMLIPWSLR